MGKNDTHPPERGEAMTAVAMYCRSLMGLRLADGQLQRKHGQLLLRTLPEWDPDGLGVDMYYWFFGTRAMQRQGGPGWHAWTAALRDALLDAQRQDGEYAGSFDPIGPWGYAGGRAYATALMALCLEATRKE